MWGVVIRQRLTGKHPAIQIKHFVCKALLKPVPLRTGFFLIPKVTVSGSEMTTRVFLRLNRFLNFRFDKSPALAHG